jgi:hypothetical protein
MSLRINCHTDHQAHCARDSLIELPTGSRTESQHACGRSASATTSSLQALLGNILTSRMDQECSSSVSRKSRPERVNIIP